VGIADFEFRNSDLKSSFQLLIFILLGALLSGILKSAIRDLNFENPLPCLGLVALKEGPGVTVSTLNQFTANEIKASFRLR